MAPTDPSEAPESGPLTARQRRIVDFIATTVRERGYPPTVREIGEAVGLTSSSSVHAQLANLERRGLLTKDPTKPRAMTLSDTNRAEGVVVPLVGRIAAGTPVLAEQNVEEHLVVPMGFAGDAEHFALTVTGDSMVDAGILDGDVVIVRGQDTADDGDVVAVLLPGPAEDEATVKRLRRQRGKVTLVPENPTMEPFDMDPDGRILGKVVAVLASCSARGPSPRPLGSPDRRGGQPLPDTTALERQITSQPEQLEAVLSQPLPASAAERLRDAGRIWLVGTGTSQHAAELGALMLQEAGATRAR